jgi:CRP-like cAMP-binding protein
MSKLREYLQSTKWFTESELNHLCSYFQELNIRKKEHLLHEGEICKRTVFVEQGCFRTYTVDNELHESVLFFGFEGWWLADLHSLEHQKPTLYNIQAIEDSLVRSISRKDFFMLMELYPKFKEGHIQLVRKSYAAMMNRIQEIRFRSLEERYLDLLRSQPDIFRRVPQQYIAAFLGIEPQSLSRLRKRIFDKK